MASEEMSTQFRDRSAAVAAHLAAFGAVIYRYAGQEDIAIDLAVGEPAGRVHRCTLAFGEELSTRDLLQQAQAALPEAWRQGIAGTGSLRVRFGWRGGSSLTAPGLGLSVTIARSDQTTGEFRYTDTLSPHAAPSAVWGQFQTMLAAVQAADATTIDQVGLLTEAQRQAIFQMGRGRDMPDLLEPILLHQIFEATADRFAQNVAVTGCGQQLTYAQLEQRANQLARHLRKVGVSAGAKVGMLLPRGTDVHVAILGILKSGAAYVPLDSEYPPDRVAYILDDCKVAAVVTTAALAEKHALDGRHPILLDRDGPMIERHAGDRLAPVSRPDDLCYVIYTSGSTGKPKGVPIQHRSASHLVLVEKVIYGVEPSDRVFEGFSVAFDASVEEVWLAFASGASLFVGSDEMVHSGPALPQTLTAAGVTVWTTIPTLLAMMPQDVPTLRLLILGGESCPTDLVRRWQTPQRRIFNTYGPTEATVIATYALCSADRPVTIGRPLPNYRIYMLDRHLVPVPLGAAGELCIGGVGVSGGYLRREDLTAERFGPDPFAPGLPHARLYRTGDLARFAADGQIEYLGRADTQVKIRGFRVELSEIESVLMEYPDIQTAVVAVRQEHDNQQLVGYIIPKAGAVLDEDATRGWLRTRLPAYMIPALLEVVAELPTMSSGKVDRKRLPAPRPRKARSESPDGAPQGLLECGIVEVWRGLLSPLPVSRKDDFFLDLGGHSLLAARMVSQLRKNADFADLSVTDVYNFPTPQALAAELARRQASNPPPQAPHPTAEPISKAGYYLCCLGQAIGLYFIAGVFAIQWMAPYLVYNWLADHGWPIVTSIALALAALLAFYPTTLLLAIVVKWTVIGRYRAGQHRLWGWYYLRWWLVEQIVSAAPLDTLAGTGLLGWYYRLMGARVGKNVFFGTDNIRSFDLVSVGDDSSIGFDVNLLSYTVEDGLLKLAPTTVGQRCFVGTRSILGIGSRMQDDAGLCDLSLLPDGQTIPRGQRWIGSPARPLDPKLQPPVEPVERPAVWRRVAMGLAQALAVLVLPAVYLLAVFPGVVLLNYGIRLWGGNWFLLLSPAVAVSFVVLLSLEIALVKWLVLGRVSPGTHGLTSEFYFRKWFFDQLMHMSLDMLGPLYSTLYLLPWYRLLGARLGKFVEISTACAAQPDLLDLDDGSFVADCVSLGAPHVDRGHMTLADIHIGKRAFIGNSALVPIGAEVGDDSLIGCLSAPPLSAPGAARQDTSWLGSPAIFLPQRPKSTAFGAASTFRPSRWLFATRLFFEFLRVTLPTAFFVAIASVLIVALLVMHERLPLLWVAAVFPLLYIACGLGAILVVVAAKWLLMGVYRPGERPLWSAFVWKTELLTALHENLANPFLAEMLRGTPWVCWFFRLMGAKIGERVFMDTTALTEFDLIDIGDGAMLNDDCTIQTHLFEDRVMKMSTIEVGRNCSVGPGSIVLYDTRMEDGSALGGLSLLMKGETLPAGTRWEGSPARRTGVAPKAASAASVAAQTGCQVAFQSSVTDAVSAAQVNVWVLDMDRQGGQQGPASAPQRHELGRALMCQVVGHYLNVPPARVVLAVDAHGRPALAADQLPDGCPRAARLDLNMAHRENVFVAALSTDRRVGIDVELIRDGLDIESLANGHFCPAERQWLMALEPRQRQEAFYRCWTLKEALAKALGQGMSLGMDQIETALNADGSLRLVSVNGSQQLASGWQVTHRLCQLGDVSALVAVAAG